MEQTSYPSCPIDFTPQVEELTTRIVAAEVSILIMTTLLSKSPWVASFLLTDFLLRSSSLRKWSPLGGVARLLRSLSRCPNRMINAAPKLFAAKIGAFFSLLLLLGIVLELKPLLYVAAAIFALCALLEATIGFCLACKLYPLLLRLGEKKKLV